jgi:hypothetical protein
VAPQADAAAALAAVSDRQPDAKVTDAILLGSPAQQLDVVGDGPAYTTRDGNVSLDAGPGQRLRLLAADTDGGAPLVVAVLVPGGSEDAMAQAMQVVATARRA